MVPNVERRRRGKNEQNIQTTTELSVSLSADVLNLALTFDRGAGVWKTRKRRTSRKDPPVFLYAPGPWFSTVYAASDLAACDFCGAARGLSTSPTGAGRGRGAKEGGGGG
ncbi:hypothetical protein KM043_015504 [Ampulex compressa]|nr:hypothetical protein KM043_015504 [Ampulex compressa]